VLQVFALYFSDISLILFYSVVHVNFVINCLSNVVAAENIVVVIVPMAEMVEKLSHHRCGMPVEFVDFLEPLLVMAIILGLPVLPEFSLI
jgi:hypothetical protein